MSELFDDESENMENDVQKNESTSMSLDDRKEQLEDKINREMSEATNESKPVVLEKNTGDTAEIKSPYDRPPSGTPTFAAPAENSASRLPKLGEAPPSSGSSFVAPYYGKSPYGNTAVADYTGGVPAYAGKPPKQKMSGGLKSYLIIMIGITVVFLLGFILECVHAYSENGVFGGTNGILSGDWDEYLDTDFDFGFKFNDDDEDDNDSDSDNNFDYVEKNDTDTDDDMVELKKAPDENSVVNKSAANLKAADQPEDIDSAEYTARKAFKKIANSVVNVVVYNGEVGNDEYSTGSGSGIIISEDGYIVTNSHVINNSKQYGVEIITTNGNTYIAAIVGYDPRTDLAVLKIDETGLQAAEFVNSEQIEVGQDAIVVGSPGGVAYSNSLTRGCVSALNRTIKSNNLVQYIQTDAAINPGNSGGPLLNSAGQVMGITTIKIANSDYEGMGFAIPSNTVIEIVNDIIGQGYVSNRVRLGIVGVEISGTYANNMPSGIVISEFADDSPLLGTEAEVGDVLTGIGGTDTPTFSVLYTELAKYQPGEKVTVTFYRAATSLSRDKTFDVEIELIADNGETQRK